MGVIEEIVRIYLIDTGFITFVVPSILFMAMTYIFLTKSKIIGSKVVAATFSFLVFLLVLVFPIISGIDISIFLSTFFVQFFFISLTLLIGLVVSSIFYPDFLKVLERFQKSRSAIMVVIVLSLIVFITSGALSFILSTLGGPSISTDRISEMYKKPSAPVEVSYTIGILIFLIIFAVILIAASRISERE